MPQIELHLARIGNSRGIRLPSALIRRHSLENGLILEDRGHEIVLTAKPGNAKLSWEATAREMAAANEDWSDWEAADGDGLEQIPWEKPSQPRKRESKLKSKTALKPARASRK